VDPDPLLTINDSASPTVFSGFPNGTKIKLVQAPGAPTKKEKATGDINWKITLNGDALVTAIDASGNKSAPVSCRVPHRHLTISQYAHHLRVTTVVVALRVHQPGCNSWLPRDEVIKCVTHLRSSGRTYHRTTKR
jgi:hypothetical protein